jgi:hypothetical protein
LTWRTNTKTTNKNEQTTKNEQKIRQRKNIKSNKNEEKKKKKKQFKNIIHVYLVGIPITDALLFERDRVSGVDGFDTILEDNTGVVADITAAVAALDVSISDSIFSASVASAIVCKFFSFSELSYSSVFKRVEIYVLKIFTDFVCSLNLIIDSSSFDLLFL